ncbi:hypothetical protein MUA90_10700 [Staphylococcus sp. IVB6181]|uniref:phage tail spike protein n=1 Tax=Staphylococcus sp. IVB6181 TaxID=2929481 RepID=UPI0021D1407F|nr:phage tail spike protein [Staphylococcus sp. IVB6181]UXV34485.1 hypothetical protein MUA90_10700 [Staphylococcus sp. IVB6181]
MIHVLDYQGKIIDFIAQNDNAVISAVHHKNINERSETFDFTILSERAEHLQDRNRIIIQDSNEQYREFIIEHTSQDIDGYTEVETSASYLEDISKSKPYSPGKLPSMTTSQALRDVLKDTGWQVSDRTEYGGTRSTSWTSFQTRYEVLMQLCTTYKMIPDFYVEVGRNRVEGRYVVLKTRAPLFKGKEIVYGKDLLEMKRTVDMTEIKTALLASGPQKEDGTPGITLTVKDDEANNRYSLPGRYLWGIYSPETEDENMTESRLRTLATTELNKRKAAAISYEVKAADIKRYYPHEVIRLGDKIRIKNEDFVPSLYLEAEVIGEDYDLISGDSEYSFGEYKEYAESELKKAFEQRLRDIQQKLNDKVSNINTIIEQTQAGNLEYFEKKIIKGAHPPKKPVNDLLWLDTSNPDVAVLKRYWNGRWLNATAEKAEDIGAVTREKALYSELTNTFINLNIQHSKLLSEVYEVIDSEYFVDTELKQQVQQNLDNTINTYNEIKTNLDSMKPETATIGKLVDTQALFLKYRELLQTLYNSLENAKIAIDDRFKLLQSQYTDEKFNEAMQNVASKLGLTVNENNQLVGEVDVFKQIDESVREVTNQMLRDYVTSSQYQSDQQGIIERLNSSDSERKQLSNQIADRVTRSEYENDVGQKLINSKAEVLIEAEQTSNRVSKEIFNENSKTLERYTSEFINDVSSGMFFNYDDNGNIQSANIGRDGIKLKGDRVNIKVNKDFKVMANAIDNKVGKHEVINSINVSNEGIAIDANKVGIRGGDGTTYLDIQNTKLLSRGFFERTWGGETDRPYCKLGIYDGHLIMQNETSGRNLYLTEKGLSTTMAGNLKGTSGTLQFHFLSPTDNTEGVRLHSYYGMVYLQSQENRVYIRSKQTTNIETADAGIYLRPYTLTRQGVNEFSYKVIEADNASDTDGYFIYGEVSNPDGLAGSGIRFRKKGVKGNETGEYEPMIYATDNAGNANTGSFSARNFYGDLKTRLTHLYIMADSNGGEIRATSLSGERGKKTTYVPIRALTMSTQSALGFTNHSKGGTYFGVGADPKNKMYVTDVNGYNNGRPQYRPVVASAFTNGSKAEYKKNIMPWHGDALKVIDSTELYTFNYKGNYDNQTHHGVIIGEGYHTPNQFIQDDGVNLYDMLAHSMRAIQQLNEKVKELEDKLNGR